MGTGHFIFGGLAYFSKPDLNEEMLSGRADPWKPSASSSRKDWRIASREKEKMDRKDFTMRTDIRMMRRVGARG